MSVSVISAMIDENINYKKDI